MSVIVIMTSSIPIPASEVLFLALAGYAGFEVELWSQFVGGLKAAGRWIIMTT